MSPAASFEEIYATHVVAIYRYVHARVGNRPDAEDVTAAVFTRAVEQLDVTRQAPEITAWLYRVAANAVADYWRAFYRLPHATPDELPAGWEAPAPPDEPPRTDAGAARRLVAGLLEALPPNYRLVLELRFLERCTVAETAARMGTTRGNVKVLQYRALRRAARIGEAAAGG